MLVLALDYERMTGVEFKVSLAFSRDLSEKFHLSKVASVLLIRSFGIESADVECRTAVGHGHVSSLLPLCFVSCLSLTIQMHSFVLVSLHCLYS